MTLCFVLCLKVVLSKGIIRQLFLLKKQISFSLSFSDSSMQVKNVMRIASCLEMTSDLFLLPNLICSLATFSRCSVAGALAIW